MILSGEYCKVLPSVYLAGAKSTSFHLGQNNFINFGPDGREHFPLKQTGIYIYIHTV